MPSPQPRPDPGDRPDRTHPPSGRTPGDTGTDLRAAKAALRREILARRAQIDAGLARLRADGIAARAHRTPEVRRAGTVACYLAIGTEPGTGPLLERLLADGKRVLLPVLLPDNDLDWAEYAGPDSLRGGRHGLSEPTGQRLGVDAIGRADVVLVPGLAVSSDGHRLGRGGGSYDRALARVPASTYTAVLLHPEEVGVEVPVEPHDRPVDAAITAQRLHPMPGSPGGR
ncbi:5-formyltetrahydrofolate cyclo-ligase [Nocardioides sambongensis]|uniref:5-formyltetrahydrofolate cyclo-ligase n=1 Tax=Nocardioides sambongensis TaxID=2589074 RepID=UPI001E45C1B1|nr:5-formyltetrahydrofolate cyclo-ligase [Nocardioides sambongensis]